ncbi:hypothetical protein BDF19DRAFT_498053, partial [Syncephalis fuscata]
MPVIDHTVNASIDWMHSAKKIWGIPLNPLGELTISDFYKQGSNAPYEQYTKVLGCQIQLFLVVLVLCTSIHNIMIAGKMTISRPRMLLSWCCIIPPILGILTSLVFIASQLGAPINCRILMWSTAIVVSCSNFCNGLILLQKAYLILCRQKWI